MQRRLRSLRNPRRRGIGICPWKERREQRRNPDQGYLGFCRWSDLKKPSQTRNLHSDTANGVNMPPRPNWKGYLKLSLVSCPIALYPASSAAERVSFRQINKKTGNGLKQQLIDSETLEPIDTEDKGRGYEIGKNEFMQIED